MSRKMKDSGIQIIGEIPDDMNVIRIKFVANIFGRIGFRGYTQDDLVNDGEGAISLSPSNLKSFRMSYDKRTYISWSKYEESPEIKIENGDILFVKTGSSYGKSCIVKGLPEKATINPQLIVFKNIKCNNKYLFYLLQTSIVDAQTQWHVTGGTIPTMSQDKIENFYLPYYEDDYEQQQIVHFLDRKCTAIDTAIEKTKKSIEKLEEYKKAVITKAVTKGIDPNAKMKDSGVEWIGEMPEGWKVAKTKYLFRILKRIAGQEGFDVISITQKGLKIKDINSNEGQIAENYSNYQFVFPGDFAMNHMDLLTGWVDLSTLTGVTSPDYRVFHKINESINDDYYKYVFQSLYFNKVYYGLAQGVAEVGRKRLQAPAFKELKLPCPPTDEPANIATYIKDKCMAIDALIEKKQTAINKWEEYKKSLIYYAVTGKIDCRNEVI